MKSLIRISSLMLFAAACLLPLAPARAMQQPAQTPQQYSITQINALFGPSMNTQIYRDGQMAMMDSSGPPADNFPKGMHTRTYYDLKAGKQYTVDLNNPSSGCGTGTFSGDWGDPFSMSAQMLADDPDNKKSKPLGVETVAGVSAKVFETTEPTTKLDVKYWLDQQRHLILKLTMAQPGGAVKTMLEVRQVSLAKPPAALLVVPAACLAAAAAAPPSDSQRIAAETGGNGANYANAIMPPPSGNACNVVFKVVQAKTLQPVQNFKMGLDRQVDPNHMPSYQAGGNPVFSGGNIRDVTGQLRNGSLRIDNAPSSFDIELLFGANGGASALIYRQCYGPETTLLFVVKNADKIGEGGDWLWVKKQ